MCLRDTVTLVCVLGQKQDVETDCWSFILKSMMSLCDLSVCCTHAQSSAAVIHVLHRRYI